MSTCPIINPPYPLTLAARLGIPVHVSPLYIKAYQLFQKSRSVSQTCIEEWLLDVANARGATVVVRSRPEGESFTPPLHGLFPNEHLVVVLCLPQLPDQPQILRPAAQLISRQAVDIQRLKYYALLERVGPVLAELAKQALRVDPAHPAWLELFRAFSGDAQLRDSILHWTRLAEPIPGPNGCCSGKWKLVA